MPRAIAAQLGRPLISTTATQFGSEPIQWPEDIAKAFPQIALVLDAGPGGVVPTTVLDLTVQPHLVVRQGAGSVDFFGRVNRHGKERSHRQSTGAWGFAQKKWPVLEPMLRDALGVIDVQFTKRAGDGTPMAKAAVEAGGSGCRDGRRWHRHRKLLPDAGSVFGKARGANQAVRLVIFRATGGDLRRILHTPSELADAAAAIAKAAKAD